MEKLNQIEHIAKVNAREWRSITVVDTRDILAIAEAFRALEQRAETAEATIKQQSSELEHCGTYMGGGARYWDDEYCSQQQRLVGKISDLEAKLAELEKPEPIYQLVCNNPDQDGYAEWADCNPDYFSKEPADMCRVLFSRPAPAVSLAELVPPEADGSNVPFAANG